MDDAQDHAGRLRDRRGNRRRPDAPVENRNKQQIQHDIGQRGQNQIIKRPAAVAEGVHDALAGIVHHNGQNAGEIIPEIGDRFRQNLRVGPHPPQERRCQPDADDCQEYAREQAEGHVRMHGARDLLVISGPKEAGDGHARAHGHAFKEADQQKDQRPGRADRRERFISKEPADDQRVRRII